jgi:fermentation-respiration switch protein FrsA (DUF1100 family)
MPATSKLDLWPENDFLSYQLLRLASLTGTGGADLGECLYAAGRIDPDDPDTWTATWVKLAQEVEAIADDPNRSARTRRDAHLRACNYWRSAEFLLPYADPLKMEYFLNCQNAFLAAIPNLPHVIEPVQIPYQDSVMEAYFVHPEGDVPRPWPVVIFSGTWIAGKEEFYFVIGRILAERGFAVLHLDAPGEWATLRLHDLPVRPDYEAGIAPSIDWLTARPEIDAKRIGIIGGGGGCHYTVRAAAREPRIAACVAWNAWWGFGDEDIQEWREALAEVSSLDELVENAFKRESDDIYWEPVAADFWTKRAGTKDFEEFLGVLAAHNLDGVLQDLTCPLLVVHGADDGPEDAERTYAEAGSADKTLILYGSGEPGSRHVQVDCIVRAQAEIADWFEQRLA